MLFPYRIQKKTDTETADHRAKIKNWKFNCGTQGLQILLVFRPSYWTADIFGF